MNEFRIKSLEDNAASKDKELIAVKQQFLKMTEDFNYNITLIEERDAEVVYLEYGLTTFLKHCSQLDRYDTIFGQFRTTLRDKDVEISELKIQVTPFKPAKHNPTPSYPKIIDC